MAAVGDVPLTPIIDTVTGSVTEIGRIFLRTLAGAVNGLAPIDASYWVSRAEGILSAEVNLGALPSGYLKLASAIGVATPSTVATIPPSDITGLPGTLAGLAPLASPAFTGTPTAPTAAPGTSTTQLATTAFVQGAVTTGTAGLAKLAGGNAFTGAQSIAGLLTVTGFGVHTVAAGGAGNNAIQIRNTGPGATAVAQLAVGNDLSATTCILNVLPSTFASASLNQADGVALSALGAGGFSISALHAAGPLRFYAGGATERLRIAATGEVLINAIAPVLAPKLLIAADQGVVNTVVVQNTNPSNSGNFLLFANSAGAAAGNITQTGAATIIYGATSDARLKDDDGAAHDLDALRAIVVHDFRWKADGVRDRGIFAQDAHALYPRAVVEGTDETTDDGSLARPWMTDYSKFVPDLIVGWQQHDATIAALRAELAALKGSR